MHLNLALGNPTALVLLDLSAAFDIIDHETLVDRLCFWFGVCGSALDWFVSYISDRKQAVKVNNEVSESQNLWYGVPQGSVLEPLLLSMYSASLRKVISGFKCVKHLLYADDTQVYISVTLWQ